MPQELLQEALAGAEAAAPAVKAAAWLHVARVLYRFEPQRAVDLLRRAIALIAMLPVDDQASLNFAAAAIAATVSPAAALALADRLPENPMGGPLAMMLNHMATHGFRADAVAYLSDPPPGRDYPFAAVTMVVGPSRDEADRRKVLRGALRAFGRAVADTPAQVDPLQYPRDEFLSAFAFLWPVLPADEGKLAVRAIVRWILAAPDRRVSSGGGGEIAFSSSRQMHLFTVIGPLRALDPDLLQTLLVDHPQLKRAAEKMPSGFYGVGAAQTAPAADRPIEPAPAYEPMDNFGGRFMPVKDAVASGFQAAFEAAERLYAADVSPTRPNEHPCEVWPSTAEYRQVLHQAAHYEGRAAVRYLPRVPHADVRLLASIELAAALADLPLLGHQTFPPGMPRHRPTGPALDELPPEIQALIKAHRREPLPPPQKPNRAASPVASVTRSTKAPGTRPSGGSGPDFWTMEHAPLRAVLARLYDTLPGRIELPPALEEGRYDFTLVLDDEATARTMIRLMQEGIARDLRVTIREEGQTKDVYVLTAPAGIEAAPSRDLEHGGGMSTSSTTWTTSGFEAPQDEGPDLLTIMDLGMARADMPADRQDLHDLARRLRDPQSGTLSGVEASMTMSDLAELVEVAVGRPVIDESGLPGAYDLHVETERAADTTFAEALERAHGVVLTPARREVPMLVVRPR